jgi:hypothetical protein
MMNSDACFSKLTSIEAKGYVLLVEVRILHLNIFGVSFVIIDKIIDDLAFEETLLRTLFSAPPGRSLLYCWNFYKF